MSDLITEEEINLLKTSPRRLSWKDVVPSGRVRPPVKPVKLKSGYFVSYTIDSIFKGNKHKIEHVIVRAVGFEPDHADADEIAYTILGKCARAPLSWSPQEGATHYFKMIGLDNTDTKLFYEEAIENGVSVIEVKK